MYGQLDTKALHIRTEQFKPYAAKAWSLLQL